MKCEIKIDRALSNLSRVETRRESKRDTDKAKLITLFVQTLQIKTLHLRRQREEETIMPSGKSFRGVAKFLHKTLGNFKSICFGEFEKLHNTHLLSPFSCSGCCPEDSRSHEPYFNISDEKEYEFQKANVGDKSVTVPEESVTVPETTYESPNRQKKKQKRGLCLYKRKGQFSNEETKGRDDALAQKMKDLNMMDFRDVDHALDVREALCCYSSIRSPVYLDIVDDFFMDMYHEFSDPHTSSSINSLRSRAGSLRL